MKKVFGVLALLAFLFALGTVGAIEQDMVGLAEGFVRAAICIALMWLFGWLAGGFNPPDYAEDQKEPPKGRNPKDGKRKSSKTV